MDFNAINVDLITSSTCRLCLKNTGTISIHEYRENDESLADMITFITSLTVRVLFLFFSRSNKLTS